MMATERVEDRRVGQRVHADDALTVDVGEVVVLGERLEGGLPVHRRVERPFLEELVSSQVPLRELGIEGSEVGVQVDPGVGGQHDPHEPVALLARELDQAVGPAIDRFEPLLTRQADQLALGVVGPRVVRAREATGRPATVGRSGTAVTAVVEEGPDPTVVTTGHQHRGPDRLTHDEVVGLRQLRRAGQRQRRHGQHLAFAGEQRRIAVVRQRNGEDLGGHLGRPGIDDGQGPGHEITGGGVTAQDIGVSLGHRDHRRFCNLESHR